VHVLVLGSAGLLGRKLTAALAAAGVVSSADITRMSLNDIAPLAAPRGFRFDVATTTADLASDGAADEVVSTRPDVIFHLAAVLSGEAEADFDKGYRVNLDGSRALLDAIRRVAGGYRPRLIFASSIAVFGQPLPRVVSDDQCLTPLTSYGTQKAMAELLLCDYTRRGYVDGVALRLPTICVRPGQPNQAASGFFSSIIREPLNGAEAVLPVPDSVRHWFASPRAAVGFLVRAAAIDGHILGDRRCLTMPGVSATVAEQIAALARVGGEQAVGRIRRDPDPTIMRIVASWPQRFDPRRARQLGFRAEQSFDEIIRVYVEDELDGDGGPIS
jgi:D-erythronate 2-dehydrogenase